MAPDRIVMNKTGTHYFLGHKEVSQAEYEAEYPPPDIGEGAPGGNALSGWPIHSDALAYHPKQKAEAEAHLAKLGVPTEIDSKGRPILRDRAHRREVLRVLQCRDNNSFTGY